MNEEIIKSLVQVCAILVGLVGCALMLHGSIIPNVFQFNAFEHFLSLGAGFCMLWLSWELMKSTGIYEKPEKELE